jgi:transposase
MADVESLLEEIATLRGMVADRDARLAEFTTIETELRTAMLEIEHLKLQLATLRRQRFGRSSEKLDREITQLELRLEELEENLGEKVAAQDAQADPGAKRDRQDRRKPGGRKPLPAHLPRERVFHEPEIRCTCGNCDPGRLVKIGESVTEVLEKIPARTKVIEHVRPKFACRLCEAVFQAPAPDLPIDGGRPGPGLLANVAVSKYCDGLPLNRQAVIFAREGIEIDRATLAGWMGHVAWWIQPLVERIGEYVVGHDVVWTDDTPIRTLAPGNGKTRISRFWCYAVDPRPYDGPGHPAVFYRYSANRKGEQPRGHLENFSGYLHTDAFSGYNALYRAKGNQPPRATNVACWAHYL